MNLVEIEKVVGKLQNQLFKKANHYSVGAFKSHFRGAGLQFREHQIYNPGDDVRFIDWKLSAKSVGKTYVKTFEEDRNVEVVVVIIGVVVVIICVCFDELVVEVVVMVVRPATEVIIRVFDELVFLEFVLGVVVLGVVLI